MQVAQAGRVGRRDVDRKVGSAVGEAGHAELIVGHPVGAVLVGADVDADDAGPAGALAHALEAALVAFIVEAEAVDDAFVGAQAEDARLRIAGLGERRDRTDLGETEAEA